MFRQIPASDEEMRALLRDVLASLDRLESGGAIAGRISLATTFLIGDVEVIVADTGGGHRTVTFRNPNNGVTSTITL